MSTAGFVPETASWRGGDGPLRTARAVGVGPLLSAAVLRLRRSDGFSHARALAFVTMLLSLQGMIAVVALLVASGNARLAAAVQSATRSAAPGPVGQSLQEAVNQAKDTAALGRAAPLVLGVGGALVLGTTGMGQLQRALNRLYGIELDRPSVQKYLRAFLLTVTAGTALTISFVMVAFGRSLSDNLLTPLWGAARLPVTLVLLAGGVAVLFRWCPDRRQPSWPWLAAGSAVAVVLWLAVTAGLAAFFRLAGTFNAAYGPLAGLVGLGLWSLFAAVALLFGAAVNAELEWRRATAGGEAAPGSEAAARATTVTASGGGDR